MTSAHYPRTAGLLLCGLLASAGVGAAQAEPETNEVKEVKAKRIKIIKRGKRWPHLGWFGDTKKRGYLGVQLLEITEELRRHYGAPRKAGVLIARVEPDSPAAAAGLAVGDVLVAVDGDDVDSAWDVARRIGKKKTGDKARLKVVRSGKARKVTAKIQVREKPQVEVSRFIRRLPGGDEEIEIEIDTAPLEESMQRLERQMEGLEQEEAFELHREEDDRELQRRLEEMERKLDKLERELEQKESR